MDLVLWISNLKTLPKLALGLIVALIVYIGLRLLIYKANKDFVKIAETAKPRTQLQVLQDLSEGY